MGKESSGTQRSLSEKKPHTHQKKVFYNDMVLPDFPLVTQTKKRVNESELLLGGFVRSTGVYCPSVIFTMLYYFLVCIENKEVFVKRAKLHEQLLWVLEFGPLMQRRLGM